MDSRKQRKILFLNLALAVFIVSGILFIIDATGASNSYNNTGEGIDLFGTVYGHVVNDYVKDVDPADISRNAIEGILKNLDPYSNYLPPIDYNQLREGAQGEFGGLGIEIATVNEYPRVMSYPLPDSPAEKKGLRAGDVIEKINGENTHGLDINEVVSKLRGKVNTDVTIHVRRSGVEDLMEIVITRGRISLKNVPYYGEIEEGIGYIKLTRFNDDASDEMDEALEEIQNYDNLKGVILDLRGNPGGLLSAAQEVANKFLAKKSLIVYTKGRDPSSRLDLKANDTPFLHPNVPLVVLIDMRSASASEIVAGAIQDHDRGVLIGDTTWGKGSVQTVYNDLPNSAGIKLTTALYYTPSGRCIHNERNFDEDYILSRLENVKLKEEREDTAVDEDSLEVRNEFHTLIMERVVYEGGGITPDIIVREKLMGSIVRQLSIKSVFMNFAVEYVNRHPDLKENFTITDQIMKELKEYSSDDKVFEYTYPGKDDLEKFRKTVEREKINDDIIEMIDEMQKKLTARRDLDFDSHSEEIKQILRREIVASAFGPAARTIAAKEWDMQLKKTIEVLNNPEKYNSILTRGAKTGIVEE